jgi:dipeptidyl aminopeptidase/acylaminoacyl peptidase
VSSKVIEAHRIVYGPGDFHFGDLRLPRTSGPHPVAIMVHGGFWRARYGLEYFSHASAALTDAGIATWNMEYRRLGNTGGGWPGTFEDVAEGAGHVARIADEFNLDLDRIIAVGHSAGGHLALWLAGREKRFRGVISLAGVADLRRAWELRLSNTVVADLLGGSPEEVPERYQFASPIDRLPIGTTQKLFHGTADTNVPYEISERYVRTARLLGDDAQLITLENAGHFELVDPRTKQFGLVRDTALSLAAAVK